MQYLNCGFRNESADYFQFHPRETGTSDVASCLGPADWQSYFNVFRGGSIPSIVTLGCRVSGARYDFSEIQTIYGGEGSTIFAGGLVYSWLQNANYQPPLEGKSLLCFTSSE
jgi:hypothetical protein